MGEQILTLPEVSERTRVPLATLRYWRSTDPTKGPRTFRMGARVMAKASDVEAWIEAQYEAGQVPA